MAEAQQIDERAFQRWVVTSPWFSDMATTMGLTSDQMKALLARQIFNDSDYDWRALYGANLSPTITAEGKLSLPRAGTSGASLLSPGAQTEEFFTSRFGVPSSFFGANPADAVRVASSLGFLPGFTLPDLSADNEGRGLADALGAYSASAPDMPTLNDLGDLVGSVDLTPDISIPGFGDGAFSSLPPGRSLALSLLGMALPGPAGFAASAVNAGLGVHASFNALDRIERVTGVPIGAGSKFAGFLSGITGIDAISDYGHGIGGYGEISEGGYSGTMNVLDPGVAGPARAAARTALDAEAGLRPYSDAYYERVGIEPPGGGYGVGEDRLAALSRAAEDRDSNFGRSGTVSREDSLRGLSESGTGGLY